MLARDFLLIRLQDRCDEFARHGFACEFLPSFAGADPWLLASLLQKAIRRSDLTMARRAGFQLLSIDPSRLWRRLMVVGLEDIGIGDPEAAALLVCVGALPEARAMLGGGAKALQAALQIACGAIKDRTGDCLGAIAREFAYDPLHSLSESSEATWIAVLGQGHLPWRRRLRAAWLLGRDELPAPERARTYEPVSQLFRAIGVPEALMAACELYRGKARDLLPLFVPLTFNLWQASGGSRTTLTHALSSGQIGAIPDYAFDPLHTRLGRKAVELWLRSYAQKPPFEARQVAIALWNTESAAGQCVLDWPLGREIEAEAWSADLLRRGLRADGHQEIRGWLHAERDVLAFARQTVWQGAYRPSTVHETGQSLLELQA